MRKLVIIVAVLALAALSCKNKKDGDPALKEPGTPAPVAKNKPQNIIEKILGSFVGAFGDNKITLLITRAEGDSVAGRSIVGGNDRPFAGTLSLVNGVYNIIAREPGDDKNDGQFQLSIKDADVNTVTGSWTPYAGGKPEKVYTLQRKSFQYRVDVGYYPQASQRLLKTSDVENMMKSDLELMRNEIFARHGYCFKKKDMRAVFEQEEWYVPNTVDIKDMMTEVEKKNIALIKRYEKYADDYGDDYGR